MKQDNYVSFSVVVGFFIGLIFSILTFHIELDSTLNNHKKEILNIRNHLYSINKTMRNNNGK